MDATCRVNYYAAKAFGLLPLAGDRKPASVLYTVSLWTALCTCGAYVVDHSFKRTKNVPSKHTMLMRVIFVKILFGLVMAVISTAVSVKNSRRFLDLSEKFAKFDRVTASRSRRPSNDRPRTFYLFTAMFIGVYNLTYSAITHRDVMFYVLLMWSASSVSTMVPVVQYAAYVRMLRERYALANGIFSNSVLKNSSSSDIRYTMMYPKEIKNLFTELRDLTDEVKTFYAYHVIIVIIESVLILVTSATMLTVDYLNQIDEKIFRSCYCIGQCALRLLFLYYVVREAHEVVLETKNTALIAHQALSVASEDTTIKYLEVIILNCWNYPIKFDVHDFFDLDYNLLQSIIASVVTYVVVLVQIQLAIMNM